MGIFINELHKGIGRKAIMGICLALTLLNGVLLWVDEQRNGELYTPAQYREAFAYYGGMGGEDALGELSMRLEELGMIWSFQFGADITQTISEHPQIDGEELLRKIEDESYLVYSDNLFIEQELLRAVRSEIESCVNYGQYLQDIDGAAERMANVSIFSDPESFSYKNIVKTPKDFAHLKGSMLAAEPSKGVEMATDFPATDLIGFFMILTVAAGIISREKELNQLTLSRTTFRGRSPLGISKLSTCFFAALLSALILYFINFLVAYFTFGFGDCSRQLQSVYEFNGSSLKISVLQYFCLFLAAKALVYCVYAALICFAAVICDTSVKLFAVLAAVMGTEAVFYGTISSTSYLSLLKHINLVSFLYTKTLFAKYQNLNFFGIPVNAVPVFVCSAAIMLIVFSVSSVAAFCGCGTVSAGRNAMPQIKMSGGRTVSVFLHECYKIMFGGKVFYILAAFAAFAFFSYKPMKEDFATADEIYYKQYMLMLDGPYTQEKQAMLDAEDEKLNQARMHMMEELAECEDEHMASLVAFSYRDILAPQNAFQDVLAHAEYLRTTQGGEFLYDSGYRLLTGEGAGGRKDLTLGLTAALFVLICAAGIYSIEYQTGADRLLKASYKGRRYTFGRKFFVGLLIVTTVYIITYVPYYYNVLSVYGTDGINAPACSMETLSGIAISIKGYLCIVGALRFFALVCEMAILCFLSARLKSFVATLLAGMAVFVVPLLLVLLGVDIFRHFLFNPFLIGNRLARWWLA